MTQLLQIVSVFGLQTERPMKTNEGANLSLPQCMGSCLGTSH